MTRPTVLLIGASRGLGLGMAEAFLERGWQVVGTVRGADTGLHLLSERRDGVVVERLDVNAAEEVAALRERLAGRHFNMLFINAGTIDERSDRPMAEVDDAEFARVMATNALAPMRVIAAFEEVVADDGLIGAMSSLKGSVGENETGDLQLYRASKAALNQNMRSYAARQGGADRSLVLMVPGWVRTDMGGPDADLGIGESASSVVDVLLAKRERPGLHYLDYEGREVAW